MANQAIFESKTIDQTIQQNLDKLRKPGVLTIRPGYEITGETTHRQTGNRRHRSHEDE